MSTNGTRGSNQNAVTDVLFISNESLTPIKRTNIEDKTNQVAVAAILSFINVDFLFFELCLA